MTAIAIGILIIVLSFFLAGMGCLGIRKLIGVETLKTYNNVAGNMFQVVGTLYAVLLGLIVVDAMNSMNELRVTIESEANSIVNIYILASGLPSQSKLKVQSIASNYVNTVVEEEWQSMQTCSFSRKATIAANSLWTELISCTPENDSQQEIRSLALEEMSVFGDSRRKRLVSSAHGVSSILWMVLITGALFTIFFTYFFGLEKTSGQIIMTGIVAASVSLNIYLVYLFGYPFSGVYRLEPEGFIAARAIFTYRKQGMDTLPDQDKLNIMKIKEAGGHLEKVK